MTISYNTHRRNNTQQDSPNPEMIGGIYSQISQLNHYFANYQIYNDKKIESLNTKVELYLKSIDEKLDHLSVKFNELSDQLLAPMENVTSLHRYKDGKILEIFHKHITTLSKEIQGLGSSVPREIHTLQNYVEVPTETLVTEKTRHHEDTNRDYSSFRGVRLLQSNIPTEAHIDNTMREDILSQKALRLRPQAHQPSSAPSSPLNNRYSFDLSKADKNLTNRAGNHTTNTTRVDSIGHAELISNHENSNNTKSALNLDSHGPNSLYTLSVPIISPEIPQYQRKEAVSHSIHTSNKSGVDGSNLDIQHNRIHNDFSDFEGCMDIGRTIDKERTRHTDGDQGVISTHSQVMHYSSENDISSDDNGTSNIAGKYRISKPKASGKTENLTNDRDILERRTKGSMDKEIPGLNLLRNAKVKTTPQYKLEKSLKNVEEIWIEYAYGINGKPPLKELEAQYNAKWRNETELRTFLRRKKIYDAIEKGKAAGYDETKIINELEALRTYEKFGVLKKKPLLWLYTNIPIKFTG